MKIDNLIWKIQSLKELYYTIITFDNFVSEGTFGILPRKLENAVFMLCVRLRSFLFAVFLFFIVRTAGF